MSKANYLFYTRKNFFTTLKDFGISIFKLGFQALCSPVSFIKAMSFKKIKIFIRALRTESPDLMSHNFSLLLEQNAKKTDQNFRKGINKFDYKQMLEKELDSFLSSDTNISFNNKEPELSIVMVLHNSAPFTLHCLQSTAKNTNLAFELFIIDNNSTDRTHEILKKLKNCKIIYNHENLHFIKACNQVIEKVSTPYLLFLNNDVEIHKNSIETALSLLQNDELTAAVGAKILGIDNSLQEAGSIVWKDGSCHGYGRNEDPDLDRFSFNRQVDYCSGAFLMTKVDLFRNYGGFDESFFPAYYEETDYCMWLQKKGYKCIYSAASEITHFEFGSGNQAQAFALQKRNQQTFLNKHKDCLENHYEANPKNILNARYAANQRFVKKVLYIDDRVPHADLGAGLTRANEIANRIQRLGYQLTIFPLNHLHREEWSEVYKDISPFIEVIKDSGHLDFSDFIRSRKDYYDIVWVSRPHNMDITIDMIRRFARMALLVYDAEAIFADRIKSQFRLKGIPVNDRNLLIQTKKEVKLAMKADTLVCVSSADANRFSTYGLSAIDVLGHTLKNRQSNFNFSDRKDLLFVGNLENPDSPNTDSVKWFRKEILELIIKEHPEIKLTIVGSYNKDLEKEVEHPNIKFMGKIPDLSELYDKHRIFIAPTRFASGIPHKLHEAASNGIPIVATNILQLQLKWTEDRDLISCHLNAKDFAEKLLQLYTDEEKWSSIQANAYKRIENELRSDRYDAQILRILNKR